MFFSAGLLKTHNLAFQDSESLQAVFDKDSCANVFRSQPRYVKYLVHRGLTFISFNFLHCGTFYTNIDVVV